MQKEVSKEFQEEFDKLRSEARELYAQTVRDVSDCFPQDNPEKIIEVWNNVLEKLYTKLSTKLLEYVEYEDFIEIIRIVFALEIASSVFYHQKGKAEAWQQLMKCFDGGLTNDETVFRLIWRFLPFVGRELDSEKVLDEEADYIRSLSKDDFGVRSISRIMGRSTETIHRILKG